MIQNIAIKILVAVAAIIGIAELTPSFRSSPARGQLRPRQLKGNFLLLTEPTNKAAPKDELILISFRKDKDVLAYHGNISEQAPTQRNQQLILSVEAAAPTDFGSTSQFLIYRDKLGKQVISKQLKQNSDSQHPNGELSDLQWSYRKPPRNTQNSISNRESSEVDWDAQWRNLLETYHSLTANAAELYLKERKLNSNKTAELWRMNTEVNRWKKYKRRELLKEINKLKEIKAKIVDKRNWGITKF